MIPRLRSKKQPYLDPGCIAMRRFSSFGEPSNSTNECDVRSKTMTRNYPGRRWIWMLLLPIGIAVTSAQEYEITRSTIDGGGAMRSAGGDFELSGTIGQPDAGVMQGDEFTLAGGFWFEEPPDDCNSDGWVDLLDYDDFDDCLSGPGGGFLLPECNCFDVDGDDDVDLSDIHRFQHAFTGG